MFKLYMALAVIIIVVALFLFAGVYYIRNTMKSAEINCTAFNKQSYVKKNRRQFGVENRGTSMDGKEIFTVSPVDMGL